MILNLLISSIQLLRGMNTNDFLLYNKYQLTSFQQRVLISILSKLTTSHLQKTSSFNIKARELMNSIQPKMSYDDIRKDTEALLHKVYEIDEVDYLLQVAILASVEFVKGQGIMKMELSRTLIPYLLQLKKNYQLITIRDLISFQSNFSKKIYLLLLKYGKRGEGEVLKVTIQGLKKKLGIENQYKDYNTFKKRIILQAQKELHYTRMAFTFEEVKEGRKVEYFTFKLQEISQINISTIQKELKNKLCRDLELTPSQAKSIVINFMPEEIHPTIYQIKERHRSGQIKSSLSAYSMGVFNKMLT